MLELICPTLATRYITDRGDLLSTHRSSTGAIGYARCVCGGLVVLTDVGNGWRQSGHAAGRRTPAGTTGEARPTKHRTA